MRLPAKIQSGIEQPLWAVQREMYRLFNPKSYLKKPVRVNVELREGAFCIQRSKPNEGRGRAGGRIALTLPAEGVLWKEFRFPVAIPSDLSGAIALKVRQSLPGAGAEFEFRHDRGRIIGSERVFQVAIARTAHLKLIANEAADQGLKVASILAQGEGWEADFVPPEDEAKVAKNWMRIAVLITIVGAAWGNVALLLRTHAIDAAVDIALAQNKAQEEALSALSDSRAKDSKSGESTKELLDRFVRGRHIFGLPERLATILPETVWLSEMNAEIDQVDISVLTRTDVTKVQEILQSEGTLSEVELTGSAQRDFFLDVTRMSLHFKVGQGE